MTISHPLILLVEDDKDIRTLTRDFLLEKGFHVVCATNGKDAIDWIQRKKIDLFILDIMLPQKDGFEIARHIRTQNKSVPIIFLSALGQIDHKLKAFDLQADDYLTKPFELRELHARITNLFRRFDLSGPTPETEIQFYEFRLHPFTWVLSTTNSSVQLKPIEFHLLQLFFSRENGIFPKAWISERIWHKTSAQTNQNLEVQIHNLRKKLTPFTQLKIKTIRGIGYQLTYRHL